MCKLEVEKSRDRPSPHHNTTTTDRPTSLDHDAHRTDSNIAYTDSNVAAEKLVVVRICSLRLPDLDRHDPDHEICGYES